MIRSFAQGFLAGRNPLFAVFQSVGAQIAVTGANVGTGILTARLLGPDGRGIYAAVTTWPILLSMIAISGLGNAVVFRLRKLPDLAGGTVAASLILSGLTALAAIVLGAGVIPLAMPGYGASTVLLAQLCLVGVLTNTMYMLAKQIMAGIGAFRLFNISSLLPPILYLALLIALALISPLTPLSAIVSLLVAAFAALVIILPSAYRLARVQWSHASAAMRSLISYSVRAAPTDLVVALSTYGDRLVLIPLLPPADLGIYVVAYSLSRIVQLIQPAITSVIFSNMSGRTLAEAKLLHDYTYRFLLIMLAIACCGLIAVGRPLLVLMYGEDFASADILLQLLLLEAAIGVLNQVTIQLFLSYDRPGIVSSIQLTALVISLGSILLSVPRFGAEGAAIGLLIGGMARLVMLMGALRFGLGLTLPNPLLGRSDIAYLFERLASASGKGRQ